MIDFYNFEEWRGYYMVVYNFCYHFGHHWLFLWLYSLTLKSSHPYKVHYTLFVTVRKQWRNDFFAKKIKFCKKWRKGVHTLFVINPSFRERVVESKIRRKKFFDFIKKPPTPANAFCEKVFHKTLINMTNYSLYTIRSLHGFRPFVPFSSLFANSV